MGRVQSRTHVANALVTSVLAALCSAYLNRTLSRELARKVKDRVVIVLTSSRRFSLGGINGSVGEVGIGDPRLTTTPKATKRFLNAWKLG